MKLWHSFVKEVQLSSKSWYFYIEIGMAVILLLILLLAVPEESDSKRDEYLYAGGLSSDYVDLIYRGLLDDEDEDNEYERVQIKVAGRVYTADLFVTDTRNIYFLDDREAVLKLAEDEEEVGVEIIPGSDGGLDYLYYLQGYESQKLKNLYMVLQNSKVNFKFVERHMDRQTVEIIDKDPFVLNNRENIVPVFLTYNGSIMGLFIMAAYIFLDKKEGIAMAYAVTASKIWHYLLSKIGVMMVTTISTSLILVIPVMGANANYPLIILLVLATAFAFSSLGLVVTTYYRDMMQSFGVFFIIIVVMILPNISYFAPSWEPSWIRFFPTYHILEAFKEAISPGASAVYVLNVSIGFLAAGFLLFMFANYRFKKTLTI